MCSCLLLLTGINFIVYDSHSKSISLALQATNNIAADETLPEKPIEEKSASGNLNIQEEYVHDMKLTHILSSIDDDRNYRLIDEANLATVHFELISPPPDL